MMLSEPKSKGNVSCYLHNRGSLRWGNKSFHTIRWDMLHLTAFSRKILRSWCLDTIGQCFTTTITQ